MSEDDINILKDCPSELLQYLDKPKAWRVKATQEIIGLSDKIKDVKKELSFVKKETGAVIALAVLILSIVVKSALS